MLRASKLKSLWNPIKKWVRNYSYGGDFIQFLRNQPETKISFLENGLTVASEKKETPHVCVGLFIDGGSRYENDFENGISHFFEHIAYTTTRERTKEALHAQMNCSGAKFGCFTSREMCGYYAECMADDLTLCVDILTDCVYNNAYNPNDIDEQRAIVMEELATYDKDPVGVMYDYLHATAYQGTPLAKTVLGLSENLQGYNEGSVCRYLCKFFTPTRTVLAACGAVDHDQLDCLAKTYLGHYDCVKCTDRSVYRYTGSEVRYRDDSQPYANVAYAYEGPPLCDDHKPYIDIAVSLMGGWDRSQFGGVDHGVTMAKISCLGKFCDAYKAFALYYKETSLWGVHFLSTSLQQEDMLFTIQDNLMKTCVILTKNELQRAKRHEKTKILSKNESLKAGCVDIGRYMLYNNHKRPSLYDRICDVDRVTLDDFKKVIEGYAYDKCPVVAAVGPCEGLPEYTRIRGHTWWLRL